MLMEHIKIISDQIVAILCSIWALPLIIYANQTYEPRLSNYSIENDQVNFKLDNGWVFIGKAPNPNMLYALDRIIGMRVRVETFPQSSFLDISFENPTYIGSDKISFLGYVAEDTYKQFALISDIEINNTFFFPDARVRLSDGSYWIINKDRLFIQFIETYWSKNDRILVTKNYLSENEYSLVNLDVSGCRYVDYYKDSKEHWYSMRDPRTVDAIPFDK